jgi:predicted HicB family RNase H-like nuclease
MVSTHYQGGTKMGQLTVRLPDDLHTKIKVIAAYEDTPINSMVVDALQERVNLWEHQYGRLPMPGESRD